MECVNCKCVVNDALSIIEPLIYDPSVTILQALEDVFDLSIDLASFLGKTGINLPRLCKLCWFRLQQLHEARVFFLDRSQDTSLFCQLMKDKENKDPKCSSQATKSHSTSTGEAFNCDDDVQIKIEMNDDDTDAFAGLSDADDNDDSMSISNGDDDVNNDDQSNQGTVQHRLESNSAAIAETSSSDVIPKESSSQGIRFLKTTMNKDILVLDRFTFYLNRESTSKQGEHKRAWLCSSYYSNSKCKVYLHTSGPNDNVKIIGEHKAEDHCCDSDPVKIADLMIRNKLSQKARECNPPNFPEAFAEALTGIDEEVVKSLPRAKNLFSRVYNKAIKRQKMKSLVSVL